MAFGGERRVGRTRPLAEQLDRRAVGVEGGNTTDTFAAHPQRLPTGRQDLQVRAPSHQLLDEDADLGDKVFAVVDHHQQPALTDPVDDPVEQRLFATHEDRQLRCHRADDRTGVGDRGEIDEEHALVEVGEVSVAELDRGPCLAHPAGARQRDDAPGPKLLSDLLQQPIATDERRCIVRQVRAIPDDTARLRKLVLQIGMVHLEQLDGADVAKAMCAQRTDLHTVRQNPHHFADGAAEHDLATVRCRGDAGCVVDRHAHELVVVFRHLAHVHPHADPQAQSVGPFVRLDGTLRLDRGGEAGAGRIEGEEERVALRAVLDPACMVDCGAHDPPVMTQQRRILVAATFQESCRALDVGKHEGPDRHGHIPNSRRTQAAARGEPGPQTR